MELSESSGKQLLGKLHESFGRQLPSKLLERLDSQGMNGMNFDTFFKDLNRITMHSAARYVLIRAFILYILFIKLIWFISWCSEARDHMLNGVSRLLVCNERVNVKSDGDNMINVKNVVGYIIRFYEERIKVLDDKFTTWYGKSCNVYIDPRLFTRLVQKLKSSEQALSASVLATFPFINQHKKASKSHETVNWKQLTSELLPALIVSLLTNRSNDKPISRIKALLLIFKLLLTFVEDGADTSGNHVPLPKCAVFWHSDLVSGYELGNVARREEELLISQSLQVEPRIVVCYGKPSNFKSMDLTGYAVGFVAGIAVSVDLTHPCLNYYEVTITGDNPKDISIGWGINGKYTHFI